MAPHTAPFWIIEEHADGTWTWTTVVPHARTMISPAYTSAEETYDAARRHGFDFDHHQWRVVRGDRSTYFRPGHVPINQPTSDSPPDWWLKA